MPRGNGTGPRGNGPGTGKGSGRGQGRSGGSGLGPGGYCVCSSCGEKVSHQMGVSCFETQCPKCGAAMIRDNGINR